MKRRRLHWNRSPLPADLPAAFQVDELPGDGLGVPRDIAGLLGEAQAACEELIRRAHSLRAAGGQLQTWQEQAGSAQRQAERLMAEAGRLQNELVIAQSALADQTRQAQEGREALLCRIAGEAFRFQLMVAHFQERGLDQQLGKEFERLRILHRRLERLLRAEDLHIIDPTGRAPDDEQVDVASYVIRPEVQADVIVEVLEPVVAQAGRIISRGRVVVAVPPAE